MNVFEYVVAYSATEKQKSQSKLAFFVNEVRA